MSTHIDTATSTQTSPKPPKRSGHRTAWLVVGAAFTAIVLVVTSLHVVSWLARQTAVETHTYPTVSKVDIESGSGNIKVMPGGDNGISVERHLSWSYTRANLVEKIEGDTLRVSSHCRLWFVTDCSTDYVVRVPTNSSTVLAKTSSGDISIAGVAGNVQAKASSGNVRVEDIGGNVTLATSSGDIGAQNVRGRLQIKASSGDIRAAGLRSSTVDTKVSSGDTTLSFDMAPQRVNAQGSSGDVKISVPGRDAYRTQVNTSSGDQRLDIAQDPDANRSIAIDISSGDATIGYR